MKNYIKKMIAPIIIVCILVLYLIGFAAVWVIVEELPLLVKIPGILISIALAGVGVFVLVERIHEIRSGEEDDLGKY